MKKKIFMIVLCVALVAVSVSALFACGSGKSDSEYILGKKTLICGITLYEPMNYADEEGEMTGFDTEFAQAVCAELGIEAKFQVIKWSSKETELNAKYIDCIWNGFTVNDERKQNVEFTKSYLNNTQCVVVKTSALANFTSSASCSGKTAAAEAGSAGEGAAKDLTAESKVVSVQAQMNALSEVKSGNVDFAVVDVILANSIVGNGNFSDLSIATAIELEAEEYAVGFRKGSDMAEKVNAVIDKLLQNGKLLEIAEKYGLEGQLIR